MNMRHSRTTTCVMLVVLLWLPTMVSAQADAVKLSGMWIEPVTVVSIRNGLIEYETDQGVRISRSLDLLEGLKLERYPVLSSAQEALDRGDDKTAAIMLKQVIEQAHEDWLEHYAASQLVGALERLDKAEAAVQVYIEQMMDNADLVYLLDPPVDGLARADAAERLRAIELINAVKGSLDEQRAGLLQKLLDAAGQPEAVVAPATTGEETPAGTADEQSGFPISTSAPPGSIVNFYRMGQLDRALIAVDEALSQPGRTSSELYLKGMIQLTIAEQTNDADGYKSAGLSFMRVVTYFPRSAVAGPAWLEAGYVHEKIGRPDIALKLYRRAQPLIDEKEDPACYRRLTKLLAGLDTQTDDEE